MIGLATARVLVVDDSPLEALPVTMALSRMGIGYVHVLGDRVELLPSKKLKGIRLIFLDMKLNVEGENRQIVGNTINVLKHVLDDEASPSVIVIWTKHKDLARDFKREIPRALPALKPDIILRLDKWFDCETMEVPPELLKHRSRTTKKIEEAVQKHSPLDVIWAWEQRVHDAASGTTAALSELVPPRGARTRKGWAAGVRSVLAAIMSEAAGKSLATCVAPIEALFTGLNPLFYDQLGHGEVDRGIPSSSTEGLLKQALVYEREKRESILTTSQRQRLNRILLLALSDSETATHEPGSVYVAAGRSSTQGSAGALMKAAGVTARMIVEDTMDLITPNPGASAPELAKVRKKNNSTIRRCQPFLLEVTPVCDHAQQKSRMMRFLGGVIVPCGKRSPAIKKGADFLNNIGEVRFTVPGAAMVPKVGTFVLNAHFVFGAHPKQVAALKPAVRLRADVLHVVMAWFTAHSARPGYMVFWPPRR